MNKYPKWCYYITLIGENMNKNLIIAILVVIIIACAAVFMFGQSSGKLETQINFLSDDNLQNGEQVQLQLNDSKGNALSGQSVNITFNDEKYSITTDQDGKCYLTLSDEDVGSYDIVADYSGNDKYDGCTAKVTITVTDDEADDEVEQTDDDSTANSYTNGTSDNNTDTDDGLTWNDEYGVWVDADGIVRSGQGDGMTLEDYIEWVNGDLPMT